MTPYICVSHALGTKERRCKMYTIILLSFTDFIHRDQNREGLFDIQITFKHTWKSQIYGSAGRETQNFIKSKCMIKYLSEC